MSRLAAQISFLLEADKLKAIARRTTLVDGSRRENSAEHSWHLALAAIVLREYAPDGVDLARVLELVTLHDMVEIDAGDTFAYDPAGVETKADRERAAADRIFRMLPPDQHEQAQRLWDEFEDHRTPEARYANALDRLQPLLQNAASDGGTWKTYSVTREQVLRRLAPVEDALPALWPLVLETIDRFFKKSGVRSQESEG